MINKILAPPFSKGGWLQLVLPQLLLAMLQDVILFHYATITLPDEVCFWVAGIEPATA